MELNERFDIYISYKAAKMEPEGFHLSADSFFDSDLLNEYDPDEWDCDLPWKELTAESYLPTNSPSRDLLQWLQIDIRDTSTHAHRRILKQYWAGNALLCEWSNGLMGQMILELLDGNSTSTQIIKMCFQSESAKIVSHSRYANLNDDEFPQWLDVPVD